MNHEHLSDLDIEGAALEFVSLCDLDFDPERAVKAIVAVAMRNHEAVRIQSDPSFGGLFICTECEKDWDQAHEAVQGCPAA